MQRQGGKCERIKMLEKEKKVILWLNLNLEIGIIVKKWIRKWEKSSLNLIILVKYDEKWGGIPFKWWINI